MPSEILTMRAIVPVESIATPTGWLNDAAVATPSAWPAAREAGLPASVETIGMGWLAESARPSNERTGRSGIEAQRATESSEHQQQRDAQSRPAVVLGEHGVESPL